MGKSWFCFGNVPILSWAFLGSIINTPQFCHEHVPVLLRTYPNFITTHIPIVSRPRFYYLMDTIISSRNSSSTMGSPVLRQAFWFYHGQVSVQPCFCQGHAPILPKTCSISTMSMSWFSHCNMTILLWSYPNLNTDTLQFYHRHSKFTMTNT